MYILEKSIIPAPKQILNSNKSVEIAKIGKGNFTIESRSCETLSKEGESWLENDIFKRICAVHAETGYKITIKVDGADHAFTGITSDEAYYINASEDGAVLCGKSEKGAFYACITFTKMLYVEGDEMKLALAYILDFPDYPRRGHFIESKHGTDQMTKQDWFDAIDYFAEMKINILHISVHNCWGYEYDDHSEFLFVPIKAYPELKTPRTHKYYSVKKGEYVYKPKALPQMFVEDSFGEIIAYAKKRNILVAPTISILGHSTFIPRLMPDIAALREDPNEKSPYSRSTEDRCGYCTSNPRTYEVLFTIIDEIIDRYLKPNGITEFKLGFDEITEWDECQCEICKDRGMEEIIATHLFSIAKHLKEKGITKISVYHDMLFNHGFFTEEMKQKFMDAGIYEEILVDWWNYEEEQNFFYGRSSEVNNMFHSTIKPIAGYNHWMMSGDNTDNIRLCAKFGKTLDFEGVESYAVFNKDADKNYLTLADVAWNTTNVDNKDEFDERYAYRNFPNDVARAVVALRSLHSIMKNEETGTYRNRISDDLDYGNLFCAVSTVMEYPINFPGRAFRYIRDDEKLYLPYLESIYEKASSALEFFETNGVHSQINGLWTLTAMQYKVTSEEYLKLYMMNKHYNVGVIDAYAVVCELDRLITQREKLMGLAEEVRTQATLNEFLRNMSIVRQYMIDLREYFKKEIAEGRCPKLDVFDLDYAVSDTFWYLRRAR